MPKAKFKTDQEWLDVIQTCRTSGMTDKDWCHSNGISQEVNADPVIYHWKYRLDEIDPSEQVQVDTLPLKKSS